MYNSRRYINQLGLPFRMFGIHNIFCRFTGIQIPEERSACPILESVQRRCGIGNSVLGPEALICPTLNQLAVFQVFICTVLPYNILRGWIFTLIEVTEVFSAADTHRNQIIPALEQIHGHFYRITGSRVRINTLFLFCYSSEIFFQFFNTVDFVYSVFLTQIASDENRHCIVHIRAVFRNHIAFSVDFRLFKCHTILAFCCLRHVFAQKLICNLCKSALRGFFIIKGPG